MIARRILQSGLYGLSERRCRTCEQRNDVTCMSCVGAMACFKRDVTVSADFREGIEADGLAETRPKVMFPLRLGLLSFEDESRLR